jgi:hypothetical protein
MSLRRVQGVAVLVLVAIAGASCATGPTRRDRLYKRAAFDLRCTKDEMSVSRLDDRTFGVSGCGWRATYIEECERPQSIAPQCTWVLNEKERDDE